MRKSNFRITWLPVIAAAVAFATAVFNVTPVRAGQELIRKEGVSNLIPGQTVPFAYVTEGDEIWLPLALLKLRTKDIVTARLIKLAVIRNSSQETYLVTQWKFDEIEEKEPFVWFHNVAFPVEGNPKLTKLKSIRPEFYFEHVDFREPVGRSFGPGEPPVVAVLIDRGGTAPEGTHLKYILMKGGTEEITPKWAGDIGLPVDIDGDGSAEFTADMARDEQLVYGCDICWKKVPAVLTWKDGHFLPACYKFRGQYVGYEAWSASLFGLLSLDEENKVSLREDRKDLRLEHAANLALMYAQTGNHKWAKIFGREYARGHSNPNHPILDVLRQAKELDHLECPVSAVLNNDPRWRDQ